MSARDPYRFLLRMPQELREPLRNAAETSGRSLNAEIVSRLEASIGDQPSRRRARRPRLIPAIAVAVVLAVAASGAFLQQRPAAVPDDAAARPFPAPKRTLVTEQYAVTR